MTDAPKPTTTAKPHRRASCQDETLLRDLALMNARVVREQGVATKSGPRLPPRRKPDLPRREPAELPLSGSAVVDDDPSA